MGGSVSPTKRSKPLAGVVHISHSEGLADISKASTPSPRKPRGQRRKRLQWTKEARELVRTYMRESGERHKLVTALTEVSGHSRRDCLRFARQLGYGNRRFYKEWTQREIDVLIRLRNTKTPRMLAGLLNRPVQAVRAKLRRLGLTPKIEKDKFTKYTLAVLLHVRPEVVQEWIDKRWLKSHREGTEKLPRIIIRAHDFIQFCKRYHDVILNRRFDEDRLDFIYKFVYPRDHSDMMEPRSHKRERVAHQRRIDREQPTSTATPEMHAEVRRPFKPRGTKLERHKAAHAS